MSTEVDPIALLRGTASDAGAISDSADAGQCVFDLNVQHTDGKVLQYRIRAIARGTSVLAMEDVAHHLPAYCPERHINGDRSFCVGWKDDTDLEVRDEKDAARWWSDLIAFLRAQNRARNTGLWPGHAWAHGDAAKYQRIAESAALRLGREFVEELRVKTLFVRRDKSTPGRSGPIYRLMRGGRIVCSAWANTLQLINKRQACICRRGDVKRHRALRNCESHARDALNLIIALIRWENEEKIFWDNAIAGSSVCCGTMKNCPLRSVSN